jgi:hypothetical protein
VGEPLVVHPSPVVVEARAWAAVGLNAVMVAAVVVLGVVLLLDGTTRSLVGGALLVVLGVVLAPRLLAPLRLLLGMRRAGRRPRPARLVVDDDGVTVYNHDAAALEAALPARLSWDDCVALVASPVVDGPSRGVRYFYLHFMPRPGIAVGGDVPADRLAVRSRLVGQPAETVATSWILQSGDLDQARRVLAEVRRRRPALRVVDSIDRTTTVETDERTG